MPGFYVYVWHVGGSPFYVGKGKGSRAADHLKDKSWARGRQLTCDVFRCETEAEALIVEGILINLFGIRKESLLGTLYNEIRARRKSVATDAIELNTALKERLSSWLTRFDCPSLQFFRWMATFPESLGLVLFGRFEEAVIRGEEVGSMLPPGSIWCRWLVWRSNHEPRPGKAPTLPMRNEAED